MNIPYIKSSRIIEAPAEKVWNLLVDTSTWKEWGTTLEDVDFPARYIEMGSRGRVKTVLGLWVPFEITKFESRKYWAWKVSGFQATGHAVESLGNSISRLTFEVPIFAAPYVFACISAMKRIAKILEVTAARNNYR